MSILGEAVAAKIYKVNGVDILIKSPHVDEHIAKMLEGKTDLSKEQEIEQLKKLIRNMLKDSIPDVTEEELNDSMRLKTLLPLIDIFYDATGMSDEENISKVEKIKSAIEHRREAIERAKGTRPTT